MSHLMFTINMQSKGQIIEMLFGTDVSKMRSNEAILYFL